jgi:PQQ-dependent catabolism-associated CXXCW motif protein
VRRTGGRRLGPPLLVGLMLAVAPAIGSAETPLEPEGYRLDHYRAPTPATLRGARVVHVEEAERLWREGARFVDVMPQPPRPRNLPPGTLWRTPSRDSVPGAVWLANVGYGELAPETEAYFREGLAAITEGDPSRPVVFFCLIDCWMSWNAAKRALSFGYTAVIWFPDGIDAWTTAGLPTEAIRPKPME